MLEAQMQSERHELAHSFRFYFVEGSKDDDGHLNDISADELCCTDSFDTVEQFWHYYDHIVRANELPPNTDCCIFKDGIKPDIEDDANVGGGKWTLRLRKGLSSRMFEALILASLGRQHQIDDDMCGIVVSSRAEEDIISVWSSHKDRLGTLRLQRAIIMALSLPPTATLEYKRHASTPTHPSSTSVLKYDIKTLEEIRSKVEEIAANDKNYTVPAYVWENIDIYQSLRNVPGIIGTGGVTPAPDDGGWEQVGPSSNTPPGGGSGGGMGGDWGGGKAGYVRGGARGGFRGGGRGGLGMYQIYYYTVPHFPHRWYAIHTHAPLRGAYARFRDGAYIFILYVYIH
jgi:translation initiation factor 4E